ncbi:hypothetical protein ACT4MK_18635 [Bradyrhizobium barranii]|uniref:hypothetical protein n=1 Tax=Bradyrhizobium barranii TaxID=2992140 RepID=UPI004034449D
MGEAGCFLPLNATQLSHLRDGLKRREILPCDALNGESAALGLSPQAARGHPTVREGKLGNHRQAARCIVSPVNRIGHAQSMANEDGVRMEIGMNEGEKPRKSRVAV